MLLLLGALGTAGVVYIFLRYYWPGLVLDWIYIRARKRVSDAVLKAVEEKKFFIEIFEDKVAEHPTKTFVIFEEETLTYDEIDKLANKAARSALEIGLRPGNIVAVLLFNEPAIIWTYLGNLELNTVFTITFFIPGFLKTTPSLSLDMFVFVV